MKRLLAIALTATVGLVYSSDSFAAGTIDTSSYSAGDAAGGIAGSRHNLGAFGKHVITANIQDANELVLGTSEICVFCHTPHHGASHAPLWNKGTQTSATNRQLTAAGTMDATPVVASYTVYTSGSLVATAGAPTGATLACLSCHDGVNTFDTLVNAPGKGNNGSSTTMANNYQWVFTEDGNSKNQLMDSARLNIGTTLANDHPVTIDYTAGTAASLRSTATTISAIDLTTGLVNSNDNIKQNLWAVKGYFKSDATISELLRNSKVECSSCHDPHFSNKSWTEAEGTWAAPAGNGEGEADADGMFLRRVGGNTGSGVCRTCHNK